MSSAVLDARERPKASFGSLTRDYMQLSKSRIVLMVLITTALASSDDVTLSRFIRVWNSRPAMASSSRQSCSPAAFRAGSWSPPSRACGSAR